MKKITMVFKALSDETRLRLFYLLNKTKREIAVCELVDALQQNQYNVSKHLHILEASGLLKESKSGRWVLYSVVTKLPAGIDCVAEKLKDDRFDADLKRLNKRLALRKNNEIISCSLAKELMTSGKRRNK